MLAVAPNGFVVDGDYILYILTLFFKRRGLLEGDTVVGTLMTNYGLEEALKKEGVRLIRADVGDKYVVEKINEGGYSLGGETSGHIILNENGKGATGDGILAALYLVRALFELGIKPNEIASLYGAFPQKTVNIRASASVGGAVLKDERLNALLDFCKDAIKGAGRILIRQSGTEDKLRITVEAKTEKTVDEVFSLLIPAYEEACGEYQSVVLKK
jgi:phosphoglucosamine mutase